MSKYSHLTPEELALRKQEQSRQWRLANPDKVKAHNAKTYAKRRKAHSIQAASYYRQNADKIKAQVAAYRAANPEKARDIYLKSKFGISHQVYLGLMEAQGQVCAACRRDFRQLKPREKQIDHCHKTGKVRGVLCGPCNRALSALQDNPEWVRNLANYIERHTQNG